MSDPKSTAFLFPGQGSQTLGMGQTLAQSYPTARDVYQEADEILGLPLSQISWEGPESDLNDTINTQPALFVHSIASLRILQEKFPAFYPTLVAGHSMGQISALVAAGSISFPDALRLIRKRGELMKAAGEQTPGGMAAIIGLDIDILQEICETVSTNTETVQIANDNCPGQIVISGSQSALDRAIEKAQIAGARRVVGLPVSIAAHSPLMETSQGEFIQAVENTPIDDPFIPVIGNVSAMPITTTATIRTELRSQLTRRVRWAESIQYMLEVGITSFFEIGTGSVLIGLLKRINQRAEGFPLGTPDDFEKIHVSS
jgi:[acyl-carrier-protein] S-malonyltransferase